jgi:hypothetical protein
MEFHVVGIIRAVNFTYPFLLLVRVVIAYVLNENQNIRFFNWYICLKEITHIKVKSKSEIVHVLN